MGFALDSVSASTKTHEDCSMLILGSDHKERIVLSRVGVAGSESISLKLPFKLGDANNQDA